MSRQDPIVSHGRGGAGNIERDPTAYTDGAITREGPVGDQGDGAYSSGVCLPDQSLFSSPSPILVSLFPDRPINDSHNSEAAPATSTHLA